MLLVTTLKTQWLIWGTCPVALKFTTPSMGHPESQTRSAHLLELPEIFPESRGFGLCSVPEGCQLILLSLRTPCNVLSDTGHATPCSLALLPACSPHPRHYQ